MTNDMKDCPFCGANPNDEEGEEYGAYSVSIGGELEARMCWRCGATAPAVYRGDYDSDEELDAAADKRWNERE